MNSFKYETKVWGRVAHIFDEISSVSLLEVNKGFSCSVHEHVHRWNSFLVVSGMLRVNFFRRLMTRQPDGTMKNTIEPWYNRIILIGENIKVAPGFIHQFDVLESGRVVEVYWTTDGHKVDLEDIVRYKEGGLTNGDP